MLWLFVIRRRRARSAAVGLASLMLLTACATQSVPTTPPATGAYPIANGIKATVVGTPPAWRADLPQDVPIEIRALAPLVKRRVPPVLAYAQPLKYALAAQDEAAPLVFIIAGTGATAGSRQCRLIMRMLYAVDLHAVCLPSPTSVNFMVGAAAHPVPGYMPADVAAIYKLMRAVRRDLPEAMEITGYGLTGYSLGATQAAFVARYDSRRGVFGFGRVLLINPAVSVWDSVQRMDALVENNLPGGVAGVPEFLASLLAALQHPYASERPLRFDSQFLFRAMVAREAGHRQLAAVVGLVFRLALANMAFAADVLTTSGEIVPASVQLAIANSLEPYLRASFSMTFDDYIDELLLPYWNRGARELTRRQLIASANLRSIGDWLAANTRIAVITNADDPILGEGALDFLRRTFGDRAYIFANGGHLGNLGSKPVVNRIQRFFAP